jgi:hypothetical protein
MLKVKSNMKGIGGKPSLIHESRLRDTNGSVLFRSRTLVSDDDKFAEAIATTFEITGKSPDRMNCLIKERLDNKISEEKKSLREHFESVRNRDKERVKEYLKR